MFTIIRRPRLALGSLALAAALLLGPAGASYAGGEGVQLPAFDGSVNAILGFVLLASLVGLAYGFILRAQVFKLSPGSAKMQEVGEAIRSGALAYLAKQVRTMLPLVGVLAVGLFFLYNGQYGARIGIGVAVSFLLGVTLSYSAGYIGMGMAVNGNQRTAHQALTTYKGALETAFKSGAVAGMMTVGLGLLGATVIFIIFKSDAMKVLVGFGFGGSLAALFMRVGGGIFTKSADVGADLVGKVEKSIPEDDPRNAATIADNVGDNVGDCAGMAADVFESYLVTLVAALLLGAAVGATTNNPAITLPLILFPLVIHGVGIFASVLGIASLRGKEDIDPRPADADQPGLLADRGHRSRRPGRGRLPAAGPERRSDSSAGHTYGPLYFIVSTIIGVVLALVIGKQTEYFTGSDKRPVNEVAHASQTGPATLILSGFSLGLESAAWGAVVIVVALFSVVLLFGGNVLLSAYGIALAGLGLLTTTGYVLAMDTFGPISDNAQGIFEMSGAMREHLAHTNGTAPVGLPGDKVVSKLDSAGNTTKALTKGFAIATAVIAAVALFQGFVTDAGLKPVRLQPGRAEGLHRPAHRRRGPLPVLLVRHQRRVPRGLPTGGGGSASVPRDPRHHGGHGQAGLRPLRRDRDGGGPEGAARAGHPGDLPAHSSRLRPGRSRSGRVSGGRHRQRAAHGGPAGELGRGLGQRQEEDRGRDVRRQGDGAAQGQRHRRHGGRPVQGHGRPGPEPAHQSHESGRRPDCGRGDERPFNPAIRIAVVLVMAGLLTGAILFSKRGGLADMADSESGNDASGHGVASEAERETTLR